MLYGQPISVRYFIGWDALHGTRDEISAHAVGEEPATRLRRRRQARSPLCSYLASVPYRAATAVLSENTPF